MDYMQFFELLKLEFINLCYCQLVKFRRSMASYTQFYILCSLCPCWMMLLTARKTMQYSILSLLFIYVSNGKRSAPKFLGQLPRLCDDGCADVTSNISRIFSSDRQLLKIQNKLSVCIIYNYVCGLSQISLNNPFFSFYNKCFHF